MNPKNIQLPDLGLFPNLTNADFTKLGDVTKYIGKMIRQINTDIIQSKQRVMRKGEHIYIYELNEKYIEILKQ